MTATIHIQSPALKWAIGDKARQHIERNGFGVEDIDLLVGASGGPKWLVLAGLDRVLFSEFLSTRRRPLTTLSSSIGSWRFAVMAQQNPEAALDRFLEAYLAQSYSEQVTINEVSRVLDSVLSQLLGATGSREILSHPVYRNHVVTIRSGRLLRTDARLPLAAGLSAMFLGNLTGRNRLGWFCQRAVFGDPRDAMLQFGDTLPTRHIALQQDNLELALRASGAVPLVLAGVTQIPGAPAGVYRDGGVTDYHFDRGIGAARGLVFYPHFYDHCIPGWFDKMLKRRHQVAPPWENLVMVSPSAEFVAGLPTGRIPDRKDFFQMDDRQRRAFWQTTVAESERLGEAFLQALEKQRFN
ncbi:MAG: hypothetical protein VYA55_18230 [Pseudomonadota bacterium]|nr:hypothetical protein [Pseudomonadota bacterium]